MSRLIARFSLRAPTDVDNSILPCAIHQASRTWVSLTIARTLLSADNMLPVPRTTDFSVDALKIVSEVLHHENDFKPAQMMIITTPGSAPVSVFDPAYGRMVSRPQNHKGEPTGEIQHYVDPSAVMEIYDHLASAGQEWEHAALLQVFTKKSIALAKKAPDLYPK